MAHRRGTRVTFLPQLRGPRTSWADLEALVSDEAAREAAAGVARVSTCCLQRAGRPVVHQHGLDEAMSFSVERLAHVRRPVSYKGMRNSIGRMCLPGAGPDPRSGWFESRNEQDNYRALLLERPVQAMATQPMRLEWPLAGGVRSHVPDAVYRTRDGRLTLLDVTRRERLDNPRALAVFVLAQATARAIGWDYEVRVELEPQHQRNVSFIYSHRHRPDQLPPGWEHRLAAFPAESQLRDAARLLGSANNPAYAAVFHLVARRRLFLPLHHALTVDATVRTRPLPLRSSSCLPAL